jgi:hypothetical protein
VSEGYSYATITASKDEPTRVSVSFYLDDEAWIAMCTDPKTGRAHLSIAYGDVSVAICPLPGRVTARDVRIARELASQAAAYAAELERLSSGNGTAAA